MQEAAVGSGRLRINPPLDVEEARDFLHGFESGFFSVDGDGYVQSPFLPPSANGQKILQLFWHSERGRFLFREGVCQLAAVSALVQRYGWPVSSVRLEPNTADVGDIAYGVDIVVRDGGSGSVSICGEVKRSKERLTKMLNELTARLSGGPHSKSVCKRTNHPKAEALWKLSPRFFWAVCPGKARAFRVHQTGSTVELDETPGLLRYPGAGGAGPS